MSVDGAAPAKTRWLAFAPAGVFAILAGIFVVSLFSGDKSRLPSALIGKPAPVFSLPALAPAAGEGPGAGLSDADLRQGHVTLVNVFASWCAPCRIEHPVLQAIAADADLKAKGVRLVGINYKDEPENARRFLGAEGNPYAAVGADRQGRAAIDWGVYGVPETFVVRGDGVIAYKFVGPMSPETYRSTLLPQIEKARGP